MNVTINQMTALICETLLTEDIDDQKICHIFMFLSLDQNTGTAPYNVERTNPTREELERFIIRSLYTDALTYMQLHSAAAMLR